MIPLTLSANKLHTRVFSSKRLQQTLPDTSQPSYILVVTTCSIHQIIRHPQHAQHQPTTPLPLASLPPPLKKSNRILIILLTADLHLNPSLPGQLPQNLPNPPRALLFRVLLPVDVPHFPDRLRKIRAAGEDGDTAEEIGCGWVSRGDAIGWVGEAEDGADI